MKTKKITILYDFLSEIGGLERVMFFQANNLVKKMDVELVFSHISEKEKDEICRELELNKKIPVKSLGRHRIQPVNLALSFMKINNLKNIDSDIILSHSYMAHMLAFQKKKKNSIPYVAMIHHPPNFLYGSMDGWVNNTSRLFARILGVLFRKQIIKKDIEYVRGAELVITNSKYTSKRVRKIYGVDPVVIYPPISKFFKVISEKEARNFKKKLKLKNDRFILSHGRVIPDKKHEAVLQVLSRIPDVSLVISGKISSPYLKKLEGMIADMGLKDRVRILGKVSLDDLLKLYNSASLFIMPAPKEDFGLTSVEAIACGTPVVSWKDGAGSEEIVKPGVNGYLAEPYKIEDLTKKVKLALSRKWVKKKVSESASQFSEEEISRLFMEQLSKTILNF